VEVRAGAALFDFPAFTAVFSCRARNEPAIGIERSTHYPLRRATYASSPPIRASMAASSSSSAIVRGSAAGSPAAA
jgi:hypothetical protein